MSRTKRELVRVLVAAVIVAFAWWLYGCANMTPDQTTATANAISSVVTTTGQVVTPLIINYENGQSVKVIKKHKVKPTPTPK